MMNIERDLATVLQVIPFSNTSSVVIWFSARRGRLATLAKGAQRPRSPFLGQADLFYTCEVLYYAGRDPRRLPILKECAPLKPRTALRHRWRAMLCASYISLLINRICPTQAPHPDLFRLLDTTLDALTADINRLALVFWFELRVLAELGMAPNLSRCTRCNHQFAPGSDDILFSAAAGGLLCPTCRPSHAAPAEIIPRDILGLLSYWQQAADPARAGRAVPRRPQVSALETVMGSFMSHHLDALYPGRALTLRWAI